MSDQTPASSPGRGFCFAVACSEVVANLQWQRAEISKRVDVDERAELDERSEADKWKRVSPSGWPFSSRFGGAVMTRE
jgi:hypothetical protein